MTDTNIEINEKQDLPILVKIIAIIIIVVSIIGILYFAIASIYSLSDSKFLNDENLSNTKYSHLNIFVVIQLFLHICLLISALLILRLKKKGYFLFIITFIMMFTSQFIFVNEQILTQTISGAILAVILTLYYRVFIN